MPSIFETLQQDTDTCPHLYLHQRSVAYILQRCVIVTVSLLSRQLNCKEKKASHAEIQQPCLWDPPTPSYGSRWEMGHGDMAGPGQAVEMEVESLQAPEGTRERSKVKLPMKTHSSVGKE